MTHRSDLIIQEVGPETVVFRPCGRNCFLLNEAASKVVSLHAPEKSQDRLIEELAKSHPELADCSKELVVETLGLLHRNGLLDGPPPREDAGTAKSRREWLKTAGMMVPALLALSLPRPANAASLAPCVVNGKSGFCFDMPPTFRDQICAVFGTAPGPTTLDFSGSAGCSAAFIGDITLPDCDPTRIVTSSPRCYALS